METEFGFSFSRADGFLALDKAALECPGPKYIESHESEAYQKALQALGSGAERDFRIVESA